MDEPNLQGNQPIADATAVVLAGGKSSGMGKPKALLLFDNEPLIAHIVGALKHGFGEVVVGAAPGQELPRCRLSWCATKCLIRGQWEGSIMGSKQPVVNLVSSLLVTRRF